MPQSNDLKNPKPSPHCKKLIWKIIVRGRLEKTETTTTASYTAAYHAISLAAEQVKLYAAALANPERRTARHEMRIAAKKLRYTMETYRGLYGDGSGEYNYLDAPELKCIVELLESYPKT